MEWPPTNQTYVHASQRGKKIIFLKILITYIVSNLLIRKLLQQQFKMNDSKLTGCHGEIRLGLTICRVQVASFGNSKTEILRSKKQFAQLLNARLNAYARTFFNHVLIFFNIFFVRIIEEDY